MNDTVTIAQQIPEGMTGLQMLFLYVIAPIATVFTTYLATTLRHKRLQRKSDIADVKEAIEIWKDLVSKLETKLGQKDGEILQLNKKLDEISKQNVKLLTELGNIKSEYKKLLAQYKELEKRLDHE